MSNKRISELSSGALPLSGTETVVMNQNGATVTASLSSIKTYVGVVGSGGSDVSGLSANWQTSSTKVRSASANWDSTYTTVQANSGSWVGGSDDTLVSTKVRSASANWDSSYNTVTNLSTGWNYQGTDLKALSSNWQNTYTTVTNLSAGWTGTYDDTLVSTKVRSASANWDSTYTTVLNNSASWVGTYDDTLVSTKVRASSANWDTTYINLSTKTDITLFNTLSTNFMTLSAKVPVSDPTGISGATAITNIVTLAQSSFDALTPNPTTLYYIV
jgi:hypothetical protein